MLTAADAQAAVLRPQSSGSGRAHHVRHHQPWLQPDATQSPLACGRAAAQTLFKAGAQQPQLVPQLRDLRFRRCAGARRAGCTFKGNRGWASGGNQRRGGRGSRLRQ